MRGWRGTRGARGMSKHENERRETRDGQAEGGGEGGGEEKGGDTMRRDGLAVTPRHDEEGWVGCHTPSDAHRASWLGPRWSRYCPIPPSPAAKRSWLAYMVSLMLLRTDTPQGQCAKDWTGWLSTPPFEKFTPPSPMTVH